MTRGRVRAHARPRSELSRPGSPHGTSPYRIRVTGANHPRHISEPQGVPLGVVEAKSGTAHPRVSPPRDFTEPRAPQTAHHSAESRNREALTAAEHTTLPRTPRHAVDQPPSRQRMAEYPRSMVSHHVADSVTRAGGVSLVAASQQAAASLSCQAGVAPALSRVSARILAAAIGSVRAWTLLLLIVAVPATPATAQNSELRWGGDAEGGAPFVSADPADGTRVVGFEADIAALLARSLKRTPRFIQSGFTTLDAAVLRGDFDVILSGIEDLPSRRARLALTMPYYEFEERLTVRAADRDRFRSLADLTGRRVGTLGATLAAEVLSEAQSREGVVPVLYEDDVHPYEDLALGRIDAVVLDQVLAERSVARTPGLVNQSTHLASGHYVGGFAPAQSSLRDQANDILRAAMRDGTLQRIFEEYGMWTPGVAALYARESQGSGGNEGDAGAAPPHPALSTAASLGIYLPRLLRAALITLALSCLAMILAVAVGLLIASGRVYGARWLRALLATYVEVVRGTPLLLQLFVIYFGLAAVVRLPALIAALLGLALNYAAYESEIYRGALLAVPIGQLDAARALGLTDMQTLRLVRGPQALRLALAPMTNDFIALLKDSSLVSVITVVELTKATSIFAADIGSWVVPGLACALMYLALSLPLAHVARRLERRWSHA